MRCLLTKILVRTHKRHLYKVVFFILVFVSSSEIHSCSLEGESIGPLKDKEIVLRAKVVGIGFNEILKKDVVRVSISELIYAPRPISSAELSIRILQADCSWREIFYYELLEAFQEGLALDIYGRIRKVGNDNIIDIDLPYSGALARSSLSPSKGGDGSLSDYLDRWSPNFSSRIETVKMIALLKDESDESVRFQLLLELIRKDALALDMNSLLKEYVKDKASQHALKKIWRKQIRSLCH